MRRTTNGTTSRRSSRRGESLLDQQAGLMTRLREVRVEETLTTGGAQVVVAATAPETPIAPTPLLGLALGLALGAVLGVGLAFVFDHVDERRRSSALRTAATAAKPAAAEVASPAGQAARPAARSRRPASGARRTTERSPRDPNGAQPAADDQRRRTDGEKTPTRQPRPAAGTAGEVVDVR
jgi:hypothetical protein